MNDVNELKITKSSGNIFADLGYDNPDEHLLKIKFAMVINTVIKEKKYSQTEAAEILDIDQPKVSRLLRGIVFGFSLDKLMMFLIKLNQDIEVNIKPHISDNASPKTQYFSLNYVNNSSDKSVYF
jgi:predicted XRE-type DNA-binding protein